MRHLVLVRIYARLFSVSQQWIRKVKLLFGSKDDLLDVSSLQFKFQTTAQTIESLGTLQLRIFNPAPSTIKKIIDEGSNVSLSAGYAGSFGQIFGGDIIQVRTGRENGTDTYLDISATDGDKIYNESFVNATISAGTSKASRLQLIAKHGKFDFSNPPEVDDDDSKLPRGKAFFGMARDHLRPLCAMLGADWTIKDGKVKVLSRGRLQPGDETLLTYETGLIGIPTQTMEGLTLKALLNPSLIPGGVVNIDNTSINKYQVDLSYGAGANYALIPPLNNDGKYKILYVAHSGDTRGQNWYTDIIAMGTEFLTPGAQNKYATYILY